MNKDNEKIFIESGQRGGKKTAKKYGSDYMREIGLRGLSKRYGKKITSKKKQKNAKRNKDKR